MSREASPDALAKHFPTSPFWQRGGYYAGRCGCGEVYKGTTYTDAVNAWAAHAYAHRVSTEAQTAAALDELGEIDAALLPEAVPTPSAGEREDRLTPEWCLRMAEMEGDAEIGAGALDHPLRAPGLATPGDTNKKEINNE